MAEIKGLAACTTSLNEILNEKTDQILTHINSLEARVNSLEGSVSEGTTGTRAKRSGVGSRAVTSEHPSLKVCRYTMLFMSYVLKASAGGAYNLLSNVRSRRIWGKGETKQGIERRGTVGIRRTI